MAQYMFLLRGGDARRIEQNEEEKAAHMAKWGQWMGGLQQAGKLEGGLPLSPEGAILSTGGLQNGIHGGGDEHTVGGYLMINAADQNEAVEIAKGCPIFEHEGNVEIREMMPM